LRRPVEFTLFPTTPPTFARTIYDVHVMQVKAPGESKGEWDLLRLVQTIPGESAFRPADQSACPLVRKVGQ
jgi:branched-chain amino acid transport system substrate-binding protein